MKAEIPDGWDEVNGRTSLLLEAGSRPKGGVNGISGTIPSLGGEHIDRHLGIVDFKCSPKYITENFYDNLRSGHLKEDDIIINKDGAWTGKIAYVSKLFTDKIAVNEHIFIIRNKGDFKQKFLFYYLNSFKGQKQIKLSITGAAQPGINTKFINLINIPKPPIPEQQKIASILSRIDQQIQLTEEINTKTEELKKGLMQQLLTKGIGHTEFKETELGMIPKDWIISNIGDETKVGTGGTPSRKNKKYYTGEINWFTTTELKYCHLTSSIEKITLEAIKNSNASIYEPKTLLIAMYGLEAKGTRGKCALMDVGGACNQACAAISNSKTINTRYLFYYYQSLGDKIMKYVGGTKRQNMNIGVVKSIKIPVPKIGEQEKIASIFSKIDEQIQNNKIELVKLNIFKKGLMQDLLSGKVRVAV